MWILILGLVIAATTTTTTTDGWRLNVGKMVKLRKNFGSIITASILCTATPALASRDIGAIPTSGFVFKDTMKVDETRFTY